MDTSITLMSAMAVSPGFLVFSFALSTRDDFHRIAALASFVASVIALASFIAAALIPDQRDPLLLIGRICYFPLTFWAIKLGTNLLSRDSAE